MGQFFPGDSLMDWKWTDGLTNFMNCFIDTFYLWSPEVSKVSLQGGGLASLDARCYFLTEGTVTEDLRTMGQSQGCSGGAGPSAESAFGFSACLLFCLSLFWSPHLCVGQTSPRILSHHLNTACLLVLFSRALGYFSGHFTQR